MLTSFLRTHDPIFFKGVVKIELMYSSTNPIFCEL